MSGILLVVLIFFILAAILGAFAFFTYKRKLRRAKAIERGLKMVPILIHLPPPSSDTQGGTRDLREVMREKTAQAEVLYNLVAGTATEGFKSNFYGQRHIAFELIVINGLVHFYVAVPVVLVSVVKKAVQTAYPGARLEEVEDHNIFNQEGRLAATLGGEMVLRADSGYPIATYDQLERDPLEAILTTVSALEKQDGVAIQIMMRPAGNDWVKKAVALADAMRKGNHAKGSFTAMDLAKAAVKSPAERRDHEKASNGGAMDVSKLQLSQVERIEEKTKHPGFEVLVRVIVSTGSTVRSQQLLRDLSTAFALFENPGLNGFKFLPALDVQGLVTAFIFRFFPNELSSNILNSAELATLFHLPDSQFTPSASVQRQQSKQVDGPVQLSSEGLLFGYNEFRGVRKEIRLGTEDRRRHTYILGQTGTGKSTMLENLAVQDMLAGNGFAFIDPHGDSAEKLLALVPKERAEDVIYFNPADAQYPLGLNLFEFTDPSQKDFLVQETINMLYKLYDPGHTGIIGPRYEHWYRNAALTLMADPGGSTFIEIPKVFTDTDYLKRKFKFLKDPTVIDFWTKEMGQTSDYHKSEMLGWFVSKFGAFQNNEIMRNIIGQTKSSFNIREIMDQKKILIVNLSKGRIGELNSQLLGMIFVIKFQAAAMSRADVPEAERPDFALYVDEFQNFSTDSFASILSEARKYRLNLIVANQFIGQLSNEIRDAVFGNIGTIVAHRMGPDDAEFMVKQFAPVFDAGDLVNIPNYQAAMRLMIGGLPSQPFSIADSAPLGSPNAELGLAIKQLSAAKYGRDKVVVEADLAARLNATPSAAPVAPVKDNELAAVVTPVPVAGSTPVPLVNAAVSTSTSVAQADPIPVPVPAATVPAPPPIEATALPAPAPTQTQAQAPDPRPVPPPMENLAGLALVESSPVEQTSQNTTAIEPPAPAIMAATPPPIGAPPIDALPVNPPAAPVPAVAPSSPVTAVQSASDQELEPTGAQDLDAQYEEKSLAPEPISPPPIGAPPIDLPLAPSPTSLPGTLSLKDITGGVAEPQPDVDSAYDDIPVLATPAPALEYKGDGLPLADDPYANIDLLAEPAPIDTEQVVPSDDNIPADLPEPEISLGEGRPLDDDPYADIDLLGSGKTQNEIVNLPTIVDVSSELIQPVESNVSTLKEQQADWSNAPEPLASVDNHVPNQPVEIPQQPVTPLSPGSPIQDEISDAAVNEPLIHFVDPAAQAILDTPVEEIGEALPALDPANTLPSLSGLPEGVQLIDSTANVDKVNNAAPATIILGSSPLTQLPVQPTQIKLSPVAPAIRPIIDAVPTATPAPTVAALPQPVSSPLPLSQPQVTRDEVSGSFAIPEAKAQKLSPLLAVSPVPPPNLATDQKLPQSENVSSVPMPFDRPVPDQVSPIKAAVPVQEMVLVQPLVETTKAITVANPVKVAELPTEAVMNAPVAEAANESDASADSLVSVADALPEAMADAALTPVSDINVTSSKVEPYTTSSEANTSPAEALPPAAPPVITPVEPAVPAINVADSIKKTEHQIDDLLSVSLIHSESTPGHKRLPEPVVAPISAAGVNPELDTTPSSQHDLPSEGTVFHPAMHHGMKVILPLEPIVPPKELFAAEIAKLNQKLEDPATVATPIVTPPPIAAPQVTPAPTETPVAASIALPVPKAEAAPISASVPSSELQQAAETIKPVPTEGSKPNLPVPPEPIKSSISTPTVAPVSSDTKPFEPLPSAETSVTDELMPVAESLASQDVAQQKDNETNNTEAALTQKLDPVVRPNVQVPNPTNAARRRRRRPARNVQKPAEEVRSQAEADHNKPSYAATHAAPLTGKLILPTETKPSVETHQAQSERPKKLSPGEVYVDASGNVVIGE